MGKLSGVLACNGRVWLFPGQSKNHGSRDMFSLCTTRPIAAGKWHGHAATRIMQMRRTQMLSRLVPITPGLQTFRPRQLLTIHWSRKRRNTKLVQRAIVFNHGLSDARIPATKKSKRTGVKHRLLRLLKPQGQASHRNKKSRSVMTALTRIPIRLLLEQAEHTVRFRC